MSGNAYFLRWRGQRRGPYPRSELLSMAQRGEISPLHEISADGETWTRARDLDGLFSASPPPGEAEPPAPPPLPVPSIAANDSGTANSATAAKEAFSADAPEETPRRVSPEEIAASGLEEVETARAFPSPPTTSGTRSSPPAGAGRRLAALLLDLCILAPFAGPLLYLGFSRPGAALLAVPACLLPPLYKTMLEILLGGTLGKIAFGVRVVRASGDGPPGPGGGILRNLLPLCAGGGATLLLLGVEPSDARWLLAGSLALYGLGGLPALLRRDRRTLHDLLGNTRCVKDNG